MIKQRYLNVKHEINKYSPTKLTDELNSIIKEYNDKGYKIISISSSVYEHFATHSPIVSYDILMEKINE